MKRLTLRPVLENGNNQSLETTQNIVSNEEQNNLNNQNEVTNQIDNEKNNSKTVRKTANKSATVTSKISLQTADSSNTEEIKKKSNIPTSYLSTVLLSQKVADALQNRYNHLQIPNVNSRDFAQQANSMLQLLTASGQTFMDKGENTSELNNVNKKINKVGNVIKKYVKSRAIYADNFKAVLQSYGMIPNKKNVYIIPADNQSRVQSMKVLVNKLAEPNNPVAQIAEPPYTFAEINQLKIEQETLWVQSEILRSDRADYSLQLQSYHKSLKSTLGNVLRYLNAIYKGVELGKHKRSMGFLKESL